MIPKKLSIGLVPVLVAAVFALTAAQAFAVPRLWTDESKTTPLRDVKSTPANQPDAGEFVNNGTVVLKTSGGLFNPIINCTEIEFGTTVVNNNGVANPLLALPFGVAEGDETNGCSDNATPKKPVHTLFDTLATGPVGNAANGNVAKVEILPGPLRAVVADLRWSFEDERVWCTANANGLVGTVTNKKPLAGEEEVLTLSVNFTGQIVPVEGAGCPTHGAFEAGVFSLETPSTATEYAWVE